MTMQEYLEAELEGVQHDHLNANQKIEAEISSVLSLLKDKEISISDLSNAISHLTNAYNWMIQKEKACGEKKMIERIARKMEKEDLL